MKLLICFIFFWLMILVTTGQNVCEPVEEGSSKTLTCNFIDDLYPDYEWILEDDDGHYRTVAICFHFGICDVFNSDFFSIIINQNESIVTIKNVSRIDPFNNEGRWTCNLYGNETVVCDPLQVYVKPENPVCDNPVLSDLQTYISVTCKTDNIYPQAGCHFSGNWGINQKMFTSVEEKIYYNHTAKNEAPVYYKSECTLQVPVSSLSCGDNFFKVLMYPNVTDGSRFGVESNVVNFNLVYPQKEKFENTESDDPIIIGLSVAVVIITIVAVVIGVFMIYYRKKYKMSNRKMAPGYDEVDRAQSDQVNSYEAPRTHNIETFAVSSPRDVQLQEETQTEDGIYEFMEDDPRPSMKEKKTHYVNQKSVN